MNRMLLPSSLSLLACAFDFAAINTPHILHSPIKQFTKTGICILQPVHAIKVQEFMLCVVRGRSTVLQYPRNATIIATLGAAMGWGVYYIFPHSRKMLVQRMENGLVDGPGACIQLQSC